MFKVEFIGNLGADAEVKDINGSKFVTFRVAHVDKWTTQNGEKKEVTTWADVTLNNTESKVIPFLKTGVKVFVRGNGDLRVYSSPKDRCMKAGLRIAALEIELCGGVAELVPRQVVDPNDGTLHDVTKFYWCDAATKGMKAQDVRELIDQRGNRYWLNNKGFVAPIPAEEPQVDVSESSDNKENQE